MRAVNGVIALVVLLAGYSMYKWVVSMPNEYVREAEALAKRIEMEHSRLAASNKEFSALKRSDDWKFLAPYSERENWESYLDRASVVMASIDQRYKNEVAPILKRDHEEDAQKLSALVSQLLGEVGKVKEARIFPVERSQIVLDARDNKEAFHRQATRVLSELIDKTAAFKVAAANSSGSHPGKKGDIATKAEEAEANLAKVRKDFETLESEYAARQTNYASYADAYRDLKKHREASLEYLGNSTELLGQLDRSYVKVLVDQRIDHYVVVGRSSWCERDSCYGENNYRYPPVKVDADTYDYLDGLREGTLAKERSGWGGRKFDIIVPRARWDSLGIDRNVRRSWSDDYADFWVEKTFSEAFHRYQIIEGGNVEETEWIAVSEDTFWKYQENLGMAIATKPYGFYESETITTAEPVGMATIAEPTMVNGVATGSNRYGEWRHENGQSFWYYYSMYRIFGDFVLPGRYYYHDWNGYHSHGRRSPYYGRKEEYGTYGYSTYSSGRYRNSDYARRNPKLLSQVSTGNRSAVQYSIRGAGPYSRGRGPSGGGK